MTFLLDELRAECVASPRVWQPRNNRRNHDTGIKIDIIWNEWDEHLVIAWAVRFVLRFATADQFEHINVTIHADERLERELRFLLMDDDPRIAPELLKSLIVHFGLLFRPCIRDGIVPRSRSFHLA